jgi:predicted lipoprotein with Yx(FWY)xxD motif
MKKISMLLVAGLLVLAGCGDDDESNGSKPAAPADDAAMQKKKEEAAMQKEKAAAREGTTITVGDSEFGSMLFDSNKQAIYVFEKDSRNKTVCYGECAAAWPPVFTEGAPKAGTGVEASLLGTIARRDGRKQVTYAGKPLYFYAHEDPGVVLCHNVNLNGGLWWAVGADGKPRPA